MILKNSHATPSEAAGTVLLLQVPRTNEKKELAAEQMLASLHGLLSGSGLKKRFRSAGHERISFEIAVQSKRIGFYVWVPDSLKSFVEEQIYAQYPTVHISEVPDYTAAEAKYSTEFVTEMKFIANDALPIKTFPSFEVDPLAAITATLAKFEDTEEAWIQAVITPADDKWHKRSERFAASTRGTDGGRTAGTSGLLKALWTPPEPGKGGPTAKLADYQTSRASAAEQKSEKLAYKVCLRIAYFGNSTESAAKMRLQAIVATYKQFNTTYLNGFAQGSMSSTASAVAKFKQRNFGQYNMVCNIEEVASLYHLPHTNVETPNILWAIAKTAEPPANLPLVESSEPADISPIAMTNFRGHNTMFGMPRSDRGRHIYIIGQTGVGKSGLLELLTISDVYSPYGFAVIDPHGDYAQHTLRRIPESRVNDVVYFNPADTEFPVAFNPMEVLDPKLKTHTTSELIGVLKRMFESWGPRLEYILRYSLLALLDYPESTMLDITRILTDRKFRDDVMKYVEDPVVRNFWNVEFASWNDKFAAEAVAPVLNKVGAFTANPIVRNIIGQPKSSFNIRQIMDERKILIVNLSRGLIGEDNASLLGALMVTKIQMAAMSRADIDDSMRVPFYLYVDEFQNFATDSFSVILSEARKYGLNLTVANQYIAQMSQSVKDAVFGNVGSIVAFRMGADDARSMTRYFEPKFEEHDLVHMHNRDIVISMTIGGEKVQAFSATTLKLPDYGQDYTQHIVDNSRRNFARQKAEIEDFVRERYIVQAGAEPTKQHAAHHQSRGRNQNPAQSSKQQESSNALSSADKPRSSTVQSTAKAIGSFVSSIDDSVDQSSHHVSSEADAPQKKKRKRKRTRKNKQPMLKMNNESADSGIEPKQAATQPKKVGDDSLLNDDQVISLR